MRIALVVDRFDAAIGGLERYVADLARWLVERGDEVHVIAQTVAGREASGVTAHPLGEVRSRRRRASSASERAGALGADVVHDFGTGLCSDVLHPLFGSRIADRRRSLRALPWPERLLRRFGPRSRLADRERRRIQDRQLRATRHVVACSRMVRDDLTAFHGVDPEKVSVVPNGVDLARFDRATLAAERGRTRAALGIGDDPVFLLVAHNWRLKGLSPAIRALARLGSAAPGAHLVVVGRGDPAPYLREAADAGVAGRCRFVGAVVDPRPYFAAADVGLHPTFYDPCSLTVIEAWASGLPVVTTRWDGAAELLTEGREGFTVDDPEDVGGLAAAMARTVEPAGRREMAANARRLAEANGIERGFASLAALYERLAARRASAAERSMGSTGEAERISR